jgi:hypothetical protein
MRSVLISWIDNGSNFENIVSLFIRVSSIIDVRVTVIVTLEQATSNRKIRLRML